MKTILNKCVGIISYLPNDEIIRNKRLANLKILIKKVNELFNLPILLVAQNYSDKDIKEISDPNLNIKRFENGLGIAHAREELRKYFLSTKYDVIILLDDDSILSGNNAKQYLTQIDDHPTKLGAMNMTLHKLMSVPRNIYQKYGYDLVTCPENHTGYEDSIFFWTVTGKDWKNTFRFMDTGISDISISDVNDINSTWSKSLDKDTINKMIENTGKIIEKVTGIKVINKFIK